MSDLPVLSVGILIVSTTAAKDASTDATTAILERYFAEEVHPTNCQWKVTKRAIVSDDVEQIRHTVKEWTSKVELILVSGGTGFAESDVTPEAIEPLLTKKASGLTHAMLSSSLQITPFGMMARPICGVRSKSLIITLPGSPRGAKENLAAIVNQLPHACLQASGKQTSRKLHSVGLKALEKEAATATEGPTSPRREHSHSHSHSHGHHHHHSHDHGHGGHSGPVRVKRTEPATTSTPTGISNKLSAPITARARSSPYPMLPVSQAQSLISQHTTRGQIISLPVNAKLIGHILAADITAPEAVPSFRASIVDGYAVIASDGPGTYPVVSISHAAPSEGLRKLQKGQISRVTTGAPIPDGATAVIMVEDTELYKVTEDGKEELEVKILGEATAGQNIREVGSDVAKGSVILRKGVEVTASGGEIGVLASVGVTQVAVYKKPVVGVLSTGDEVVDFDDKKRGPGELKMGEIRDSNRPALLSVIESWGYEAVDLGVVKDKAGDLAATLKALLPEVDVLITTGGVSMGELDLLKPTLEQSLHGTIHFGRVEMKPGKPTTFATVPVPSEAASGGFFSSSKPKEEKKVLAFALPGNPASALVTFHLFVLPSLRQFSGHAQPHLPRIRVTVDQDFPLDPRPEYHRVVIGYKSNDPQGRLWAVSTGGQRSSRVASLGGANGLLCLPAIGKVGDKKVKVPRGDTCEALVIGRLVQLD
ncbi:hypothetical protein BJ508DRAFT_1577 [Ascobolus immersus RN42]|uniref:MoaB/Mog domain-containing protein n=1 Tax=Ascobolus immersus RN42 TaxID=1160509 RepID=A0A3N4IUX5_ASCIM|nr:hypothetical protein BJ508DRAFT_1577 [Ascobolus immersus RN42]